MPISLRPITVDNWLDACNLKVKDDQKDLIASNAYSLVQVCYDLAYPNLAFGIYHEETMVGFMVTTNMIEDNEPHIRWILRFMIGTDYQQKGYGRATLKFYLQQKQAESNYQQIKLSYNPRNQVAQALYQSLGFVETGIREDWDEMVAVYTFPQP